MKKASVPVKRRPRLVLLALAGVALGCWLIYTATPAPPRAAPEGRAAEEYTMGEPEYLLLRCLNEHTVLPYRIGTRRFQRLEQRFTQEEPARGQPPLSDLLEHPLGGAFSDYLYCHAAARVNAVGTPGAGCYWRALRPYTPAELRAMDAEAFLALFG